MNTNNPLPEEIASPLLGPEDLGPAIVEHDSGRPQKLVSAGFQASLFFAFFGTYLALLPAVSVTLALKVNQIDPTGKATSLSLVLGIGAFVALIAQNIFGALSDRTTSRFGMRRPWLLGGMILSVGSLFFLAGAGTIPLLVGAWAFTQLSFNVLLAGLNPVTPDQVPHRQLGRVSGLIGITQALAGVGGAFLAQLFLPNLTLAILLPGIFCLAGVIVLLIVLRDRVRSKNETAKFRVRDIFRAFWTSPFTAPDFALAWVSRLLVTFGNITLLSYQVFFLIDHFGYTQANIGPVVLQVTIVSTVFSVATALIIGRVSDRIDRRKLFVLISAIIIALAHALAAYSPNITVFIVAAGIAGIANGVYVAVDSALIADVLPNREDVGKDMGVLHLANVLPQTLVPVVAPLFLLIGGTGDNYAALFIGGAVVGIVGAIVNQFIKSVR